MKTQKILTLLIAVSFSTSAQNLKALDEKNGFREYKFGYSIDNIPNLNLFDSSDVGQTKFYQKLDEKLNIGDATLSGITYIFYKNQLMAVMIATKGFSNSRDLLSMLKELYGNGNKPNEFMQKYFWMGGKVTANYIENSITNDAMVSISSKEIQERRNKDADERKKKAKSDM